MSKNNNNNINRLLNWPDLDTYWIEYIKMGEKVYSQLNVGLAINVSSLWGNHLSCNISLTGPQHSSWHSLTQKTSEEVYTVNGI